MSKQNCEREETVEIFTVENGNLEPKGQHKVRHIKLSKGQQVRMTDKEFAQYLATLALNNGVDCCSICANCPKDEVCPNCEIMDDSVCCQGMRDYAEKNREERK